MAEQNQGSNQDKQSNQGSNKNGPSNRGFAAMDKEQQQEISSKGGRASHNQGTGHEWTSDEAREAGRKGGEARRNKGGNQGGL